MTSNKCEPRFRISANNTTTSNNHNHNHNSNDKRVRDYFKHCDDDSTKLRCLLCSSELCNKPTTSALWNHIKTKHFIDEKTSINIDNDNDNNNLINGTCLERTRRLDYPASKHYNINNNNSSNSNSYSIITNNITANGLSKSKNKDKDNNMTRTHHHNKIKSSDLNHQTKTNANNTSLRRHLDLIDYNELSLTSMKPLPSSSISKNLISRLNQLSSPVTRKLKFWNKKSFQVNQYDPSFKVIYLGNLGMQLWSKDESCLDKPLSTLWNNYLVNMKTEIVMRLTICNSGLKAITRQHGLTQYWSNRLVYCCSHKNYPKIFSWIYRHEGKKMRQELRCHAVFCSSPEKATKMVTLLNQRLACALQEFRREKKSRGPNIVTNSNVSPSAQQRLPRTIPLRRQILAKGSANFRPPLERSKSAPKLTSIIEEDYEIEDDDEEEEESHEVFEFEQSFGDRDDEDTDCDDEGLVKEVDADEEEYNTDKIGSNSLATTVNEETSNSSVYATGDISYDNKQNISNRDIKFDATPIESLEDDGSSSRVNISNVSSQEYSRTPEPNDNSSIEHNDKLVLNCHKSLNEIQSSANTKQYSSSLIKKHILANQEKAEVNDDTNSHINQNGAKNNTTNLSNNSKESQSTTGQADDISTQEIVLSWANLVIK